LAVGVEYGHLPLAGGEMRYALNARYQSRVLPAISESIPVAAGYTMLDGRASYSISHWVGTLYVDNITNQLGISSFSDPANYGANYQAIVSRPRTYGFTIAYSFKERQ
jgi:outer membrane receptor protein involved in Fe transport